MFPTNVKNQNLAYDNILIYSHIEVSVHMYNINRNVKFVIFVETAKNSNTKKNGSRNHIRNCDS